MLYPILHVEKPFILMVYLLNICTIVIRPKVLSYQPSNRFSLVLVLGGWVRFYLLIYLHCSFLR